MTVRNCRVQQMMNNLPVQFAEIESGPHPKSYAELTRLNNHL